MTDSRPRPGRALPEVSVGVSGSASDETRALARIIDSYVDAEDHIKNELQPEFERIADDKPLTWVWKDTPYDQRQAALRLATWWHGAWSAEHVWEALTKERGELEARLVGLSADVSRLTAERDEWERQAQDLAHLEFIGDPAADRRVREAEARVAVLREALQQIADPSYIGNYPLVDVISIYRQWAENALEASLRDAGEAGA